MQKILKDNPYYVPPASYHHLKEYNRTKISTREVKITQNLLGKMKDKKDTMPLVEFEFVPRFEKLL